MKKLVSVILFCLFLLVSCNLPGQEEKFVADYGSAEEFEAALNSGIDGTGKTVVFTVVDFKPDSAFGYNLIAGEHLNFCSPDHPNAQIGDTLTVRVTEIQSMLGSYIIIYERVF